jgi:histidinol-phosphate/aromatic aminotransferase/cobyric acid decarboxylase-like protein/choline kinase
MQAIILAAGMGRRLGEYTRDNTKCMVAVNGVRLIDRLLGQLSALNLSRVLIVVGYKGRELMDYIGDRYADKVKIEYADNPIYDKTNNIYSLSIVKQQLQEDDTLLIESDLIFDDKMFQMIINDPYPNLALVAKYETWMDGTMVRIDEENNIVNFIPKKAFRYEDVDQYYKTVNIYKFSRQFSRSKYVPFLDAYCKALGNNEYYEQVLRVITLLDNADMKALPIGNEKWYEIDDVQDLDIAETIFAEGDNMLRRFNYRYGGHWRFPKMLDFCYLVNPYFPPMRMKEEMKANFDTLLTEYPSGMYVNALLAGKYFGVKRSHVVVGNGAAELIKSLMEHVSERIGVVYPTFEEYPHRLNKDRIVAFVPDNIDLSYTAEDLKSWFNDKNIKYLLLINPDNPSGNFIPKKDVIDLTQWCAERGITIIVDESFVDFSDDFEHNSLISDDILEHNTNLIVVKSISKSYGVPGLRLGILACGNDSLIDSVKKDVAIWNINSFAEFYMQIFGKYTADYHEACERFVAERNRFIKRLKEVPFLRVIPTQANFFCCEITDKYTSAELSKILLSKFNIMIKDCNSKTSLEGKNYIRLSVRDNIDNDRLVDALMELG